MQKATCHFDLDLNVKRCKDKANIQHKIKILQSHIRAEFGPLQFAIRNLIGVCHFYLGVYFQAYKSFETILKEDPDNLNAIENLARVCSRLMNRSKENELIKRGTKIKRTIAMQARFRAEHAYAIAFDVNGTVNDIRRYAISNQIFTDCLGETRNLDDMKTERALWMLCMIWCYKSWTYINFMTDSSKLKNEIRYPDILETLLNIRDLVPDDKYLQCMVWGYLGYFFWKKPMDAEPDFEKRKQMEKSADVPEIVRSNGLEEHFFNPELCFMKSLKILEEIEAMQLYMGWLKSTRRFDDGIELLNKRIQLNPCETNLFSYSKRGELILEKCKQRLGNGTELSDLLDDLNKSINDFEFASQISPSAYIFGYLGTVCGMASNKGENEILMAKALCSFQRGLDCLDGQRDPWLHFKHARYLNEIGEYDSALDFIHRCVECRHAENTFPTDIEYLLNWHVEKMSRCEDATKLIPEMIYWFCDVAFHKYDKRMLHREFKKFLLKNMDKLGVDFYVQILLKNDPYLHRFFAGVLGEDEVFTALKKNFDASILTLMFERSSLVQTVPSLPLKRGDSIQPKNREGFSHDFFVIYSDKDHEWVLHSLINRLENIKNFKGLLHHRDFTPGLSILENIEKAISNSYKSIFVISPNFLNSDWCKHESQAALTNALNKKSRFSVIPIIKDNAKPPDFLTSMTHISLEDGLDEHQYERLVKALEG